MLERYFRQLGKHLLRRGIKLTLIVIIAIITWFISINTSTKREARELIEKGHQFYYEATSPSCKIQTKNVSDSILEK